MSSEIHKTDNVISKPGFETLLNKILIFTEGRCNLQNATSVLSYVKAVRRVGLGLGLFGLKGEEILDKL